MPNINELATQLCSDDQVAVYKAKLALNQAAWHAGEADRSALAGELAAEYSAKAEGKDEPKHSPKARSILAQTLGLVGQEAQVPAFDLAAQSAPDREMARWALDRIPGAASTAALIAAARADVGTEFRVGAINALGRRAGDAEALPPLKELAADKELEIRIAALEALANHGEPSCDALFAEAIAQGGPQQTALAGDVAARLVKARVRLGDSLLRAGHKDAAKAVFQAVAQGQMAEPQKKAAERALAELG